MLTDESRLYGLATISSLLEIVYVSFAGYRLFYIALLQKRRVILRSLLFVATPYGLEKNCRFKTDSESRHAYKQVVSHVRMSHVARMNESCRTYE